MASVMLTFFLHGAMTQWTHLPNGAQPMVLQVKMLNPDSLMYT